MRNSPTPNFQKRSFTTAKIRCRSSSQGRLRRTNHCSSPSATTAALRKGDWKIVREDPAQPWKLFHVTADVSESRDLADAHPTRTSELAAAYDAWERRIEAEHSGEERLGPPALETAP